MNARAPNPPPEGQERPAPPPPPPAKASVCKHCGRWLVDDADGLLVCLSEDSAVLLALAAKHDGLSPSKLIDRLIAKHATAIGVPALADAREGRR